MKNNLLTPPMRTCPHENCGHVFNTVIKENGIIFCEKCHRSLLVDSDISVQNISFIAFTIKQIKKMWKFLLIAPLAIIGFDYFFQDSETVPISEASLWNFLLPTIIFLIIMAFFIFIYEKNKYNYGINENPIAAGVDKLSEVQPNFSISIALEELNTIIHPQSISCPHCHSQKIIKQKQDNKYKCLHCNQELVFNDKIKNYQNTYQTMSMFINIAGVVIFFQWFDGILYPVFLTLLLACVIHIIHGYLYIRTPKWKNL